MLCREDRRERRQNEARGPEEPECTELVHEDSEGPSNKVMRSAAGPHNCIGRITICIPLRCRRRCNASAVWLCSSRVTQFSLRKTNLLVKKTLFEYSFWTPSANFVNSSTRSVPSEKRAVAASPLAWQ